MKHGILGVAGILLLATGVTAFAESAGTAVDDSVISTKIKGSLIADPATKARGIVVRTHDGTVELSGNVNSDAAKQRAEEIASETKGVTNVHNAIVVRGENTTAGQKIDDSVLTTKVKAALIGDPVTKAREIKVKTLRDVVQLSGFVNSDEEKSEAARVARSVDGVRNVRNDLLIKSP